MIEPTETENKQTLDDFAQIWEIARRVDEDPAYITGAPHNTPVGRLDEVQAARHPRTRWSARDDD